MEITILFSGKYPGYGAAANRVYLYHKGLVENGLNVSVVSNYKPSTGRLSKFISSIVAPFALFLRVIKLPRTNKILFAYKYGWVAYCWIWLATRIKGMKLVLEMNEKPYAPYNNKFTELKLLKNFNILMFQTFSIRLPDAFVAISDNLTSYLRSHVQKKTRILKVPIIIDPVEMQSSSPALIMYKPFLLHAGALSERKDGITGVFEAYALANKELDGQLHFYLTEKVAPDTVIRAIKKIMTDNNLENNVHFLGMVSKTELLAYQKECSMVILNKPDNEQNRYNFATKLGEYLALGKPVIYTPVGEMNNFLHHEINAFEVAEGDITGLAKAIVRIIENDSQVGQIAAKGKELSEKEFNYHYQGQRLANFFNEVCGVK